MLLASVTTFAQHDKGSFNIQPKIGINVASMTNSEGSNPRVGFVGGAEFEYQATDLLSLSFGTLYSQQGIKNNVDGVDGTVKMDYINMPVLLNFYVVKGLALNCSVKSVDFAIPFGLSYEYRNFQVDARYNLSLTKAVEADGESARHSVFQITLGYKFGL